MSSDDILKTQNTTGSPKPPVKDILQSTSQKSLLLKNESKYNKVNIDFDFQNKLSLENYLKDNYPSFFENFELSNYLSRGSSGHVYKGVYKQNKRLVAIKIMKNKFKNDKEKEKAISRMEQERKISTNLHNINVMETYAYVNINEDYNFCVLEYGKNGDLEFFIRNLLKKIIISETTTNYFAKQILDGLEYLHKKCKIVHMDIKPGNIIVDSGLSAKICDI